MCNEIFSLFCLLPSINTKLKLGRHSTPSFFILIQNSYIETGHDWKFIADLKDMTCKTLSTKFIYVLWHCKWKKIGQFWVLEITPVVGALQ